MAGEPGHAPSFIILPRRSRARSALVRSPGSYSARGYLSTTTTSLADDEVGQIVAELQRSERPVILAGNGVRVGQACASLEKLARAVDAPVTTTQGGKGVFPETDELAAGPMGEWGWEKANALMEEADLVLAVGTKLSPIDTVDEIPALATHRARSLSRSTPSR